MAESAFIIHVPEAQACVASLRERFDASVKLGIPAHITVLVPFMPPEFITDVVLERTRAALSVVPAFSFTLADIRRFPATTYLAPEPPEPFIALTEAEAAAAELIAAMEGHGPIAGSCTSVALLENASGVWRQMHAFALPRGHNDG